MKKWNEPKISDLALSYTLGTKMECGRTLGANKQCNYNQASKCGRVYWLSNNPGNGLPNPDNPGTSGICNHPSLSPGGGDGGFGDGGFGDGGFEDNIGSGF